MSKHTILFFAANPVGTDRLALDEEARAIRVALERSRHRDRFQLEMRVAARPLDLLDELRKLKPSIVHFSGHGGTSELSARTAGRRDVAGEGAVAEQRDDGVPQQGLFFQGPEGGAEFVTTVAIQHTFGAAGASVKLVVLSACYSDAQGEALLAYVGCVVGIRGSIRDDAARNFAIGFYGGLGERESVAAAYRQGCAAIGLEGLADDDKPRLSVREGVDAELVFLAQPASGDPAAQQLATPTPAYANAEVRALSEQLQRAQARKRGLSDAGLATDEVDREILHLRRQLREGGQLRAGDIVGGGRYLLIRQLGHGGFAVVWEAHDTVEEQRVAIKVLHQHLAGDPLRKERFFRGARVMMGLKHSAIVRVFDPRGEDDAFFYFVMEFMPGGNLRDAVLGKRVDAGSRLPIILQVGEALADAHRKGIVHRDIKPANILLDEHGNAKLTDFDLVGAHDTTGGTRTGALGTFVYAAPECLDRPQEATARADVFGLGMTAIFCFCGQDLSMVTFRNPDATVAQLGCSYLVQKALGRAVDWDPDQRFDDAGGMVEALHAAINGLARGTHHGNVDYTREVRERLRCPEIIGGSRALAQMLQSASQVAPRDIDVLITGPSGTGKSMLARVIRENSPRVSGPFVELNCAAIPEALIDDELFGHKRGAFIGAKNDKIGKVPAAEGGTLFLDEVAELTTGAQAKLLHLLETREYQALGSTTSIRADIRILSATNARLEGRVSAKQFREDLYYRMSIIQIEVPGLGERRDDIPELVEHFCVKSCRWHRLPFLAVSRRALDACRDSPWPGHTRQLAHAIEAAAIRATIERSTTLDECHVFPKESRDQTEVVTLRHATREFQKRQVSAALKRHDWNITETARQLDISRSQLYKLIRDFELQRAESRNGEDTEGA